MKRKLTDKQVIELRRMAKTMRLVDIAEHFGIDASSVSFIARGKTYAHIQNGVLPTLPVGEIMKGKWGGGYYERVGTLGGKAKKNKPGGFAFMLANGQRERIQDAGRLGGIISRRTKKAT